MAELTLRVVDGAAGGTEITIERELVVGRDEQGMGNPRGDPEISRRHARFAFTDDGALARRGSAVDQRHDG